MFAGGTHLYFETGAVIAALILLGRYFEAKSRGQASEAIEKLMELGAKTAHVSRNGKEEDIPIEQVKVGDILLVKPGEKIPVDGKVIEGRVPPSMNRCSPAKACLSSKADGDDVFGATINLSGAFQMQATKVGQDTTLAQIVKMVAEAQANKAPIQKLADRVSGIFVPIVLGIALLTAAWLVFLHGRFLPELHSRGRRARHRLPLRVGSCDADGHHGRHRLGRKTRNPDQERRGARKRQENRRRRVRQNRHADRGQAQSSPAFPPMQRSAPTSCFALPPASKNYPNILWPKPL